MAEPDDYDAREVAAFAAMFPGSMALRVARRCLPRAAGVTMSGYSRVVAVVLRLLRAGAGRRGRYEIASVRGPFRNQPQPGVRVHVTVRFRAGDGPGREAARP